MDLKLKYYIIRLIIPTCVGIILLSCQATPIEVVRDYISEEQYPQVKATNLNILYSEKGEFIYSVNAPEVLDYRNLDTLEYQEFPKGLNVQFYGPERTSNGYFKSKYAIHHTYKNLWEARDSVEAVSEEGDTLLTNLLYYDTEKDVYYSDQYTKIIREDGISIGEKGFKANRDLSDLTFYEPTGDLVIKDEELE